jgi:hypothetical protein
MNTPVYICGVFCGIKHSEGTVWDPRFFMAVADSPMLLRLAVRRADEGDPIRNRRTPRHTRHGIRKG